MWFDPAYFAVLFIFQFIGHRIGDFWLQTSHQAMNKDKDSDALMRHALNYSLVIGAFVWIVAPIDVVFLVIIVTVMEHIVIDERTLVREGKTWFEKLSGNHDFKAESVPAMVWMEIDQNFHYLRMFLLALFIAS